MARLSPLRTVLYGFGQLAAGFYYAFNNFTLPLYLGHFTANNIIIGWLSSTRSFEQSIIQPLVGARSDKAHTPIGRRAPFFLATMPLVALLLIVNALVPHDFSALHVPDVAHAPEWLLPVVITVFLFSLLFNIGIDPYNALLVDVTTPEERGTKSGIAQVFGFVGQFSILIIAAALWATNPPLVFIIVAVSLVVGFGAVALGVREPRELRHGPFVRAPPSRPMSHIRRGREWIEGARNLEALLKTLHIYRFGIGVATVLVGLKRYLQDLLHEQREGMKLLGVKFLYQLGVNAAVPFLTFFVVDEIGTNGWSDIVRAVPGMAATPLAAIDASGLSQLMGAILLLVTAVFALPCGLLGDRFGKKRIFALGLLVMGVFAMLSAFATSIPQLIVYLVFLGFGNSALTVLFGVYLADLVPGDRIGEFTGLTAFAETGGVVFSILLAGELLNLNLFGLRYRLIFIITGVFLLLALFAVTFVKARLDRPQLPQAA
jgi:maltose/moltooligosaccharide transporter